MQRVDFNYFYPYHVGAMQIYILISILLVFGSSKKKDVVWGFFGHKKINELAIYALPPELQSFYHSHANEIIAWSVAPDQRRYVIEEEGAKHYIDLDLYDSFPLPKYWNGAVEKYGEEYLRERGIVPWNTFFVYHRLVKAMAAKDYKRIIKISADLGHYVADAHVPLHTTSNYNGQQTDQLGIHAFWESRLPELYFESYDLFSQRAGYIQDVQEELWLTISESNALLKEVLELEAKLTLEIGEDKKYAYMQRGKRIIRMPSAYFSERYNKQAGGQVEQQMRKAIYRVSSLWFSAWVDAGQPELDEFSSPNFIKLDTISIPDKTSAKRSHDY
ncbi:MAG: zinc dependent phospholipase C family protein [Cyclobacteriaceae bacterium]|nr:zinc dependent phospholipase C family protein [Cyclobacteriaceae bacterium]